MLSLVLKGSHKGEKYLLCSPQMRVKGEKAKYKCFWAQAVTSRGPSTSLFHLWFWLVFHITWASLEKAMAPHSSTLARTIPWMEEPGGLQSMGSLRVGHDWSTSLSLSCIGEGNGNPLQCSCLENPRDWGAWWVAVCGITQSLTRLKWLSSSSSKPSFGYC